MLTAKVTPRAGGMRLSGDALDLESLYSSLHAVCDDESEGDDYPENLVFQLAYDIRKAIGGHRERTKMPGFSDKSVVYHTVTLSLIRATIQFAFVLRLVKGRQVPMKHTASIHAFGATVVSAFEQLKFPAPEKFIMSVLASVESWPDWPEDFVVDCLDIRFLYLLQTKSARMEELRLLPEQLHCNSDFVRGAQLARDKFQGGDPKQVRAKWPDVPPKY